MKSSPSKPFVAQPTTLRRQQLAAVLGLRACACAGQLGLLLVAEFGLGVRLPWEALLPVLLAQLGLLVLTLMKWRRLWAIGPYELAAQLFADLAAFSFVLYFTGGATNPFVALYLPLLGLAAVLLPLRQVVVLALVCVLAYSVLMWEYVPLVLANPGDSITFHLVGMWVNFWVSVLILVGFVARLSNRLRDQEASLLKAQQGLIAEQHMAALGNQSAALAHQLGTPVSTLMTIVNDWADVPQTPVPAEDVQAMRQQLAVIQTVLADLRSRVQGPQAVRPGLSQPQAWLQGVLDEWKNVNPDQALAFDCEQTPWPVTLAVQPDTLQLALNGVLDNARAAQNRVGAEAAIQVRFVLEQGQCVIEIQDQGGGVPAHLLPRLGAEPVEGHGQGMGLYLLSSLLAREGATLSISNVPGSGQSVQGALVRLVLPVGV